MDEPKERMRRAFGLPIQEKETVPEITAEEAKSRWIGQRVADIEDRVRKGATRDEAFEQLRQERYAAEGADASEREVLTRRARILEMKLLNINIAEMQKNPSRFPRGRRKKAIARLRELENQGD